MSMNLGARIGEFLVNLSPRALAWSASAAAPQATAFDIAQLLETNKLSIGGGPSAGGLYRVRIAAPQLSDKDLARIVKTLQDDKVVGFIVMTE